MADHATTRPRGVFTATVASNLRLCEDHYRMVLEVAALPPTRPGQFVQVQCRPIEPQRDLDELDWPAGQLPRVRQPELIGTQPTLRRPLSLAGRRDLDDGRCRLDIIYRVAGTGTRWLAGAIEGDQISILGPLGNGFALRDDKALAVLVGGGVGIPPMIYLAAALAGAGRRAVAFNGARTRALLPLTLVPGEAPHADGTPSPAVTEFAELGVPAAVATDDGSLGFAGLISHALENWLDAQPVARAPLPAPHPAPSDLAVYSCGPEPMMRAVARACQDRGIDCQLALERHMACGMGTCQSCVVKVKDAAVPDGWSYKLCCSDGPVFDATQVLW